MKTPNTTRNCCKHSHSICRCYVISTFLVVLRLMETRETNGFSRSSFVHRSTLQRFQRCSSTRLNGVGADIEQPSVDELVPVEKALTGRKREISSGQASDIPLSAAALAARNKVNEIDFCIAPADVSLSRSYGSVSSKLGNVILSDPNTSTRGVELSLTRALNNASNRAVRRILLARSWPSAEALNLSLRQVALAEKMREEEQKQQQQLGSDPVAKCPVPRSILNVLTRQQSSNASTKQQQPRPRSRTDEEYVQDQIKSFRERYGTLPGYEYAEDYLVSILSLATSGIESERADRVLQSGFYDEAYRRLISVLNTVGVQFIPTTDGKKQIAPKLLDQDICLSMLDKFQMKQEKSNPKDKDSVVLEELSYEKANSTMKIPEDGASESVTQKNNTGRRLKFWKRESYDSKKVADMGGQINGDDLGGVLLSSNEPSMTRQLNVLSNIVQRALLFGGDQELLVLAETLEADKTAFIERWYPRTSSVSATHDVIQETRPGVQYLNCLIELLRTCYTDGAVTDLSPPLPLSNSYANSYERLVASAVQLGSGYMKPVVTMVDPSMVAVSKSLPKPRTAQEGIGQFAIWESSARKLVSSSSAYPSDMEGTWEVRDEIGGKTIGSSTIEFGSNGYVDVPPPLEGLRWRLDPGPTHLDTCTFQVLSSDGTILQYRGFIDRGARLEARFSKRAIKVRGSVMFQMRDGSSAIDFYKDILPINYRQGTTKFVMKKVQLPLNSSN